MINVTWETGVIFVGQGRRDQYEGVKDAFEETGAYVRFVSSPEDLDSVLLDLRECRRVIILVDTYDLERVQEIVGKSEGVEISDGYDL